MARSHPRVPARFKPRAAPPDKPTRQQVMRKPETLESRRRRRSKQTGPTWLVGPRLRFRPGRFTCTGLVQTRAQASRSARSSRRSPGTCARPRRGGGVNPWPGTNERAAEAGWPQRLSRSASRCQSTSGDNCREVSSRSLGAARFSWGGFGQSAGFLFPLRGFCFPPLPLPSQSESSSLPVSLPASEPPGAREGHQGAAKEASVGQERSPAETAKKKPPSTMTGLRAHLHPSLLWAILAGMASLLLFQGKGALLSRSFAPIWLVGFFGGGGGVGYSPPPLLRASVSLKMRPTWFSADAFRTAVVDRAAGCAFGECGAMEGWLGLLSAGLMVLGSFVGKLDGAGG